jgi:hypothetical protein
MLKVARIVRMAVVLLVATSSSGCATLVQLFSAVQPTAAIVEPASSFGPGSSEDVGTSSAATSVDGQWITHIYHGWAGPSSQM